MPTVHIPTQLRRLTGGIDRVEIRATSLGDVVAELEARFPGMREKLVRGDDFAPHIAVSVDGDMATAGFREPVGEDSEVHFVPALGGG